MRAVERYSLFPPDQEGRRAVLQRHGRTHVMDVDGALLEAQFELDDGSRLIWLSDDSPYDEGLHVYLLGPDDTLEDSLQASADFTAGILKFHEIGSGWVDFEFFKNSVVYRLEVEPTSRYRLWLPTGWRYKELVRKHRLGVTRRTTGGK
ncbi:MAG: hypothetical protein JW940_28675 [Polyangiaceae bacterium]|nr:hypothetical protein [Polyangiaceae bacterium]